MANAPCEPPLELLLELLLLLPLPLLPLPLPLEELELDELLLLEELLAPDDELLLDELPLVELPDELVALLDDEVPEDEPPHAVNAIAAMTRAERRVNVCMLTPLIAPTTTAGKMSPAADERFRDTRHSSCTGDSNVHASSAAFFWSAPHGAPT
jgi:hypothetical protein